MRLASAFAVAFVACSVCLVAACENKVIKTTPGGGGEEGLPEGERESVECTKAGEPTGGVNAFDTTPGSEAEGLACDIGNVLDDDGNLTGLARPGAEKGTLVGHEVNGCVGVKFGDGNTISSLVMKMRPLSGMCGHSCKEGADGCGTGWKVQIFVGPSFEKLQWLQQLSLTTNDLFEYRVAVHRSYAAQYAVVCRDAATPETGDDIGIDIISGLCDDPPKK